MSAQIELMDADVRERAQDEGIGMDDAFGAIAVGAMEEMGELIGAQRSTGSLCGLDWDQDLRRLTLAVAVYLPGESGSTGDVTRLLPAVSRAATIAGAVLSGEPTSASEADRRLMRDVARSVESVRVAVCTNLVFAERALRLDDIAGRKASVTIWDLDAVLGAERLAGDRDGIDIGPEALRRGVRVLGPLGPTRTPSFLMALSGDVVADMYELHGPRLLTRNVRAFLQTRNRVNKGLQETIDQSPDRFLAYNNGLSLTASKVDRHLLDGELVIRGMSGLQIVNGGQTTASLHHAKYVRGVDVSDVRVQAKLSVVAADAIDDYAERIARYANSQSPVRMADLGANSPFLRELERVSRLENFAFDGAMPARPWYFERSRGQFATEVANAPSAAAQEQLKHDYPSRRRIDKADVARFQLSWDQQPWIVAAGGERSFATFVTEVEKSRGRPDAIYFHRLVAKAVLWRSTAATITDLDLGGYRVPTVAFTIALISRRTAQQVDLGSIARAQEAPIAWQSAVNETGPVVHRLLIESAGTRNVSSWLKSKQSWEALLEWEWQPPSELTASQAPSVDGSRQVVATGAVKTDLAPSAQELDDTARLVEAGPSYWFALAKWAKDTDNLQSWQRGIAFNIGKFVNQGRAPTSKMVRQGVRILDEATALGFTGE